MKILILLIAVIGSLYNILLSVVEYRSTSNPTPANVSDIYDEETYKKWKKYSAEHCRLSIIFGFINCAVTVCLLFFDVYSSFALLFPKGYMQLLSVIMLEMGVGFVVGIPEAYISTMVIEQKYGFNRSTLKTFIADQIRSFIINLILSVFLASLVMLCHKWFGSYMAVICAAALVGFGLLLTFLAPLFTRIGNKFTPLEDGELRDRLTALLTSHGYSVREIEVVDASRRTTKQNAYFTGLGKMKTIVLYDTLVEAMTPDEICAVFAHELGHGLHKDTAKLQAVNMVNFALIALFAWLFVSSDAFYTPFGFDSVNYGFAYILIGAALTVLQPFTGLVTNAMSRKFEFAADRQAVKEGYGAAMIPALKKLAKDNFSHLAPSKLYVVLCYSHPPIDKRISAIEKEMAGK